MFLIILEPFEFSQFSRTKISLHPYLLRDIKIFLKNINVKVEASHFKIGLLYNYFL